MSFRERLLEKDAPFAIAILLGMASWTAQQLYRNTIDIDLVLVSSSWSGNRFEGRVENSSRSLAAPQIDLIILTRGRLAKSDDVRCFSPPPFDTPSATVPEIGKERITCGVPFLLPGQSIRLEARLEDTSGSLPRSPAFLVAPSDDFAKATSPKIVERELQHRLGREGNYVLMGLFALSLLLGVLLLSAGGHRPR